MSTAHHLSSYSANELPSAAGFNFAIITAEWNSEITTALKNGAYDLLIECGATKETILTVTVPGSFELTAAATMIAAKNCCDVIICLGCVVQGETRHFDFICNAVANGLSAVSIQHNVPVIFGVLTTNTMTQAAERSGGALCNKGIEAA
ncbi:MAG: 6,7-dimethyl-8-ribityllumazine synthase, partial [Bacteroidota bacterium]